MVIILLTIINIILVISLMILLYFTINFSYMLGNCKATNQKKENFCGACQGIGIKTCPNKQELRKLYNECKLTENTPR